MKAKILLCLIVLAFDVCADTTTDSLAYKVATVDAGHKIGEADTSIARADKLLAEVAKKYQVTPEHAADMIAFVRDELKKENITASILDMADGMLMLHPVWPGEKSEHSLAEYLASYAMLRKDGPRSHQEAISTNIATFKAILWAGNPQKKQKK